MEGFESTAKEPELLVEREHLVVRPKTGGGISVNELIILVNPTEKTYWKPTAELRLPLPGEARNVFLEGGAGGVTGDPRGEFLTRQPVRPGKTPLVWSYDLPSGVTGVKFREAAMFPTVRLSLFVEGDRLKVRSPDLVAGPSLNLRGRTYQSFEGKDLLPGRTITTNFRNRVFERNLVLWSGLGVGFAALSGLGYLLVSKNRPSAGEGENDFGSQERGPDAEQFPERG